MAGGQLVIVMTWKGKTMSDAANRLRSRIGVLSGAFVLGLMCAAGPASSQNKPYDGITLVVNGFGGSLGEVFEEGIHKPLKEKYGISVEVLAPGPLSTAYARLLASRANPPFDILLTDDITLRAGAKAGVFDQIDPKKLSNYDKLYKELIPPGGYGIPNMTTAMGLVYNKEFVKNPPKSIADLARPEFKGKVAMLTLENSGAVADFVALAKANGGGVDNVDPAFEKLRAIKPNLLMTTGAPLELVNLLQRKEIWVTSYWVGRANELMDQGLPLGTAIPTEGLQVSSVFMSLVKGAKGGKYREAALLYINEAIGPDFGALLAKRNYYGPVTDLVVLPPDLAKRVVPYGREQISKVTPIDWDSVAAHRAAWIDRWNKEMR
jgi:putative spermidine/putrescine transport system substrate-binding protein